MRKCGRIDHHQIGRGNPRPSVFVILLTNKQQTFERSYHAAGWLVIAPRISFRKGSATATIARATLTGALTVTDREAFVRAACQGIGRARAFGCGLLQIVPLV